MAIPKTAAKAPRLPAPILYQAPAAQPPAHRIDAPNSMPPRIAPTGNMAGYVGLETPSANTRGTRSICSAIASAYAFTFVVLRSVTTTRKPEFMQNAPRCAMYP